MREGNLRERVCKLGYIHSFEVFDPTGFSLPRAQSKRRRSSANASVSTKGVGLSFMVEQTARSSIHALGCRNPSDPNHYDDHSEPHIRSSSAAQDGPGSPARREDTEDSELPEPRSYEFCVDDLYNFARPHRALKFGREIRTRAMQAGLTRRRLTLREIFSSRELFVASTNVLFALFETARPVSFPTRGVGSGGLQQLMTEAPFCHPFEAQFRITQFRKVSAGRCLLYAQHTHRPTRG